MAQSNEHNNINGWESLACGIVEKAVVDYKIALKKNDKYGIINLERFFNSQWCYELCGLQGDYIIKGVREHEKNNKRNDS